MDNWFNNRWFVVVVSLVFTLMLFVFVNFEVTKDAGVNRIFPSHSDESETVEGIPVGIKMDGDKYVVSGVPEFVKVTVEGSKGEVTPIVKQKNFDVYVDLEDLGTGTHTVDLKYANIPNNVNLYIEPKTIEVTITEKSTKPFQVETNFINKSKLPKGYEITNVEINPTTVNITSSEEMLADIAMVKIYVDVEGLTSPIKNREVPVNVYDENGNKLRVNVEPASVVVSVDIDNPSKKLPIKPVTTGSLPDGYSLKSIEPVKDDVEIFAVSDVLDKLDEIETKPIDLSDIKKSGEIDVDLQLTGDMLTHKHDSVRVKVDIEQTKVLKYIPVEIKGLGQQFTADFVQSDEGKIDVTLVGDQSVVSEIEKEDVELSVDVSNLKEGNHTVPIDVKLSNEKDVDVKLDVDNIELEIKS